MIKKLKKIFQYNEKKQIEKINELVENANNGSGGGGGKTVVLDLWDNLRDITTNENEGEFIFTQEGVQYVCEQTQCYTIDDFYNLLVNGNLICKIQYLENFIVKFNIGVIGDPLDNNTVTFTTGAFVNNVTGIEFVLRIHRDNDDNSIGISLYIVTINIPN